MAVARSRRRPLARPRLVAAAAAGVTDQAAARALDAQAGAIGALERRLEGSRDVVTVDLAAGDNVVRHALGRVPTFAAVAPSVADVSFAWAVTARTAATVTLTCVGASQPGALVEVR